MTIIIIKKISFRYTKELETNTQSKAKSRIYVNKKNIGNKKIKIKNKTEIERKP